MANATRSEKTIEEIMASAPAAAPIVDVPVGEPAPAAADRQNAGVAEILRKLIEYRVDPRFVRGRPKRVRLQTGEVVDIVNSPQGKKLFDAELTAEQNAINQRENAVSEIMKRVREKQRKIPLAERANRAGRVVGRTVGRVVTGAKRYVPNPLKQYGSEFSKNIGGRRGALAGLGALAGGALIGKFMQARAEDSNTELQRQEDLRRSARQDMFDLLGRKEHKQAIQMNIDDNLAQLQQKAPDLYMRVAAGRMLPQGAVVIGGVPRQDLLQQLGMSMSNGDFNQ